MMTETMNRQPSRAGESLGAGDRGSNQPGDCDSAVDTERASCGPDSASFPGCAPSTQACHSALVAAIPYTLLALWTLFLLASAVL